MDVTDLRQMVREVLREAMAARATPATGAQAVRIASDTDLQAFVARLAAPGVIEAVRAGTARFTLSGHAVVPVGIASALDGVISERKLAGIAAGTTVRLAATAVLTPMAKDMARRLGLEFERIG